MKCVAIIWLGFAFSAVAPQYVCSNDSQFTVKAGEIVPIEKNSSAIRLLREKLSFTFGMTSYAVKVEYVFLNTEDSSNVDVGFPIVTRGVNGGIGRMDMGNVRNFRTLVNDEPIAAVQRLNPPSTVKNAAYTIKTQEIWYVSTLVLPKSTETKVLVEYTSDYSGAGMGGKSASYLYGTGSTWKNGIEDFSVELVTVRDLFILSFYAPFPKPVDIAAVSHRWTSENAQILSFGAINPNLEDTIEIPVNKFAWIDGYSGDFDAVSQTADERPNFNLNVSLLTTEQLKIARNAFYAKWGYQFKSPELAEFFVKNMYGYKPTFSNVDSRLTDIQKWAINLISVEESRRNQ